MMDYHISLDIFHYCQNFMGFPFQRRAKGAMKYLSLIFTHRGFLACPICLAPFHPAQELAFFVVHLRSWRREDGAASTYQ
jgi:hypothetical protein